MSDARDPFLQDQKRRERLMDEVYSVRLAMWEAHEAKDGRAALEALERAYKLTEQIEDAQLLYVGESPETFCLPPACRQMTARWNSRCLECGGPIKPGDIMYWEPHDRACICVSCGGIPGLAREI